MKLFVGIDVSSKDLVTSMISEENHEVVFRGNFVNDLKGATELKKQIINTANSNQIDQVIIGMEATSIYSFHPAMFFQEDIDLKAFNTQSVVVDPKKTKRFHDVFAEDKNDQIDAYYIADYLRVGHYSIGIVRQENYIALQRLTRSRYEIVQSLVRAKQHFIENLYYKLNKLVISDELNTSIFGSTMMQLLTEDLTTDDLLNISINDLTDYLAEHGRGRFADPEALAKTIQKAVWSSYRLDKVVANSVDAVLSVYAAETKAFQKMIKDLDKSIEKVVKVTDDEQILRSIPGIGPVYAAGILAKYAGLSWREKQSGSYTSDNTPLKRTGNTYLRYYLVEAANLVRTHDPVFGEYYQRKYKEVKHTPSKRALVLTARKLIRVIYFLLKNHQIYQEKR
ncbi:IS110 family transposase [Limosilactobacillus reuteri]|uniref:Transposase n=1 Tax=Limosilactobacillus reuteri TaxID=1598 RepID=A0AAW4X819_LIMRT|nr:transposase [Limosilactobacillus reuteri]MCC4478564.1 transposase [Limosilactobacillus reuteri]MCC4480232.1 transposase [Limosilactobacillus reuteri]MCC4489207.1 transposase [Limosilactobacillus reuteri]MCC4493980.1 transposase [Limosilactobacillus reuteri]MCC4496206.1 transposase [Limosilactobacillus reuteri]